MNVQVKWVTEWMDACIDTQVKEFCPRRKGLSILTGPCRRFTALEEESNPCSLLHKTPIGGSDVSTGSGSWSLHLQLLLASVSQVKTEGTSLRLPIYLQSAFTDFLRMQFLSVQ